jgi:hypothetical protein
MGMILVVRDILNISRLSLIRCSLAFLRDLDGFTGDVDSEGPLSERELAEVCSWSPLDDHFLRCV